MGKVTSIVEEIAAPYLADHDFELVDIEYVKEGSHWFLRVFVDKEGGVDIDDCGRISEFISDQLDQKDPISDAYFLEVCSPGAERPLKKPWDYEKAVGKQVFITTQEAIDQFTEFEGELLSFDGNVLVVSMNNKPYSIPLIQIKTARLAIVL